MLPVTATLRTIISRQPAEATHKEKVRVTQGCKGTPHRALLLPAQITLCPAPGRRAITQDRGLHYPAIFSRASSPNLN